MAVRRNPNLGSSQAKARKRRLFFIRFYIILFFFLIILFGLAILSGHEKVTIKTFLISGNDSVVDSQILKIADQDITGRYFGLFAKNNSLIFPRFKIANDILKQFRIIKGVDISWQDLQTVTIKVSERKPYSVWCSDDPTAPNQVCYFADQNGYIFDRAPVFSGNIFVKSYGPIEPADETNPTEPIGSYFLANPLYSQIFYLIDLLEKKSLTVSTLSFDGIDFRFTLTSGVRIIFNNKSGTFISSFQNLFAAIDSGNLDLIKDTAKISYVDLRFGDKIIIGKAGTHEN